LRVPVNTDKDPRIIQRNRLTPEILLMKKADWRKKNKGTMQQSETELEIRGAWELRLLTLGKRVVGSIVLEKGYHKIQR